jgi:hypothetical protein
MIPSTDVWWPAQTVFRHPTGQGQPPIFHDPQPGHVLYTARTRAPNGTVVVAGAYVQASLLKRRGLADLERSISTDLHESLRREIDG